MNSAPSYFEWAEDKTFYSPLYASGRDSHESFDDFDTIEPEGITDTGMTVEVSPMTEDYQARLDRAFK